jgi:hypothetical protein
VLRLTFSEDYAKRAQNERWCGAANRRAVAPRPKCEFLFQFCKTISRLPGPQAIAFCLIQVIDIIGFIRVHPGVRRSAPRASIGG